MKIKLFSGILILLANSGFTQDFSIKTLPISVSYFGDNGFHPGLKLGTYYNFGSKEKTKPTGSKKDKSSTMIKPS